MNLCVQIMGFKLEVDFGFQIMSKQNLPVAVETVDPWEAEARQFLKNISEISTFELGLSVLGVPVELQDWQFARRVGRLMHKLGYELITKREEYTDLTVRRWVKRSEETIDAALSND